MGIINPSEYSEKLQNPSKYFNDPLLKGGTVAKNKRSVPYSAAGANAITFKFKDANGVTVAVRCFSQDSYLTQESDIGDRYDAISRFLDQHRHPMFVTFEFQPRGVLHGGSWLPILKMEWADGAPITNYVKSHIGQFEKIAALAESFRHTMRDMNQLGCAHGDLQHGNVLVDSNGSVRLVDYDGMYVPALKGKSAIEMGERNYQSPMRTPKEFHNRLDHFSAIGIYLSLLALASAPRLLPLDDDDLIEVLLMRQADLKAPEQSQLLRCLWDLGYQKPTEVFGQYCTTANTYDIPDLETFITETNLTPPPARYTDRALTACESVMIDASRVAGTSTAPAPASQPVTQSAPPVVVVKPPTPKPAFAGFDQDDLDAPAAVGARTTAPTNLVSSAAASNPFTPVAKQPATGTTSFTPPPVAPPLKPSVPAPIVLLPFEPRTRFVGHAVWGAIAYVLFLALSGGGMNNSSTSIVALGIGCSFAVTAYFTQRGITLGSNKFETLIRAVLLGTLTSFAILYAAATSGLADLSLNPTAILFFLLPIIAAWAIAGIYVNTIFMRLLVSAILLILIDSVVDAAVFNYRFSLANVIFLIPMGLALGALPWMIEILYGERRARRHWFNWAESTDRFIARVIALSLVIGGGWTTILGFMRTTGRGGSMNDYYRYGDTVGLQIAEVVMPSLIMAVVISGLIGWLFNRASSSYGGRRRQHPTWGSVLIALIGVGIVSAVVGVGWVSIVVLQADIYINPAVVLQADIYINPAEANMLMVVALSLIVGAIAFISARTGSTRLGHIFKSLVRIAILVGVPIGTLMYGVLYRDFMSLGASVSDGALIAVIVGFGSLLITIPLWLADYLASDRT